MNNAVENHPRADGPKATNDPPRCVGRGIRPRFLVSFVFLIAVFGGGQHECLAETFAKTLHLGAHAGYSATFVDDTTAPDTFNGVGFGLQAVYGFNRYVGLCLDAAFDWHADHRRFLWREVEEDGDVTMDWVPGPAVSKYFVTTAAISLVYTVDISRLVPYLIGGIAGMRIDRTVDDVHEAVYGIGLRLGGGLDYYFERFAAGLGVTADQVLGGNSDHELRVLFLLRISILIQR